MEDRRRKAEGNPEAEFEIRGAHRKKDSGTRARRERTGIEIGSLVVAADFESL